MAGKNAPAAPQPQEKGVFKIRTVAEMQRWNTDIPSLASRGKTLSLRAPIQLLLTPGERKL
jgi:hypothetical protein